MKYKVIIEETITQDFDIEASSLKDAKEKTIKGYKEDKFVLEPGDVQNKRIGVFDCNNNKEIIWEEF